MNSKYNREKDSEFTAYSRINSTPVAPNVQPPNVQHFFEQFVFCLVSPLCNTQEKFQLQNDKNERKWVEHGFQNDKIDL